jgi:hypothetical protein
MVMYADDGPRLNNIIEGSPREERSRGGKEKERGKRTLYDVDLPDHTT